MSRTGWSASNFLRYAGLPVSGPPFTLAMWARTPSFAAVQTLGGLFAGSGQKFSLKLSTGGNVQLNAEDGGSSRVATTTTAASTDTWFHAAAKAASATSRDVLLNGGGKGSNTTSCTPVPSRFSLGYEDTTSSPASPMNGGALLAETGLWNIALSDADIAALAAGASPLLIHPEALVGYWPLIGQNSPENNLLSNTSKLSIQGALSAGAHPRLFMP